MPAATPELGLDFPAPLRKAAANFPKDYTQAFVQPFRNMAAENDETDWIRRSRAGEAEAFAALVRQHQRMIHALTYRMTGSLAEAQDLAQETFVRAWQHLESFHGDAKFSTWLCRIAMNLSLTWRQRESRRHTVHQTWANDAFAPGPDESARTASGESQQRVQAALNRLPAKQRAAIILTVHEELTHAEAARVLECSETTVSWRVFTARAKLKRWLQPEAKNSHE